MSDRTPIGMNLYHSGINDTVFWFLSETSYLLLNLVPIVKPKTKKKMFNVSFI